ncbi:hypothetical protein HK096_000250 [Nowakowskiella sp. JEL0078]|nr:hypothetical protein HK096_000250 [Nowakowskiella sp. JEL0078]
MTTFKLNNVSVIHGENFSFSPSAIVSIVGDRIVSIVDSSSTHLNGEINSNSISINADGYLILPTFVNTLITDERNLFESDTSLSKNLKTEIDSLTLLEESLKHSLRNGIIATGILQSENSRQPPNSEHQSIFTFRSKNNRKFKADLQNGSSVEFQKNGNGYYNIKSISRSEIFEYDLVCPRETSLSTISNTNKRVLGSGNVLINPPNLWRDLELEVRKLIEKFDF